MAGAAAADRALVIALERFVRAHVHEPDFSFYMPSGDLFNRLLPSLTRRGDAPGRSYALAEALYPQYFDKVRPKYIINGDARF
jgi:hypothetical protein